MNGMNNIAEYGIKYYTPIFIPVFFLTSKKMFTFVLAKNGRTRVL